MEKKKLTSCISCGQQLRVPTDVGGMVMVCPTCGHESHTDFKLGNIEETVPTAIKPKSNFSVVV